MIHCRRSWFWLYVGIVAVVLLTLPPPRSESQSVPPKDFPDFPILDKPPQSNQLSILRRQGQQVYALHCAGCHGARGDGQGPAANLLVVKPRDFTSGIFKFRSTPFGTLPTDDDLYRSITRGIYGTSMPSWALLSERDRLALVAYIKTFYPEWEERGAGIPIHIPEPPATFGSPETVARGREIYDLLGCATCHGEQGQGDGQSANDLDPDAWGFKQRPFDFTKGQLRGGPTEKDVYRTFMTGIYGTAMPSYADIFSEPDGEYIKEGDAWTLVAYIISLRQTKNVTRVVSAEAVH